jgi:two-component system, NtrC family, sensor kinase
VTGVQTCALPIWLAHEINNPLTSVLGLAQMLIMRTPADSEQSKFLTGIEQEAQRICSIVARLRSLTESFGGEGFERLDVSALVAESLRLVEQRCSEQGIVVTQDPATNLPAVLGNRLQLRQVVVQLCDNAIKAMPQGGRLTLGLTHAGGLVRLTVEDTGCGIAPEHLDRIFDPFFTTKTDWRGTGLGLTTAFRTIEQHHGSIKAASVVGEGTVITVTLPAAVQGTQLV